MNFKVVHKLIQGTLLEEPVLGNMPVIKQKSKLLVFCVPQEFNPCSNPQLALNCQVFLELYA